MRNLKLNRTTISMLGAILAPALLANAGVPIDGFTQDANTSGAAPAGNAQSQDDPKDGVIDEFGTFEIAVEDVPLPQVLNMLAIQSRRNIITSKRVGSVSITANLFDVTFYEALDSILHIASLCYEEKGNFIYVMTCDEKMQRAQANRTLEDRVFYLDHISPGDAESLALPLLSTKGTMSKLGEVDSGFQPSATDAGGDGWAHEPVLVVRDYAENLDAIQALLTDVDTPPKQVMVESTILVTKANGDYAWGMDVSVLLKANFQQLLNPLNPVAWLQNTQPTNALAPGAATTAPTNNAIALQSTVGNTQDNGGFKFGILNDNVGVFLRLLDEVSDTTILARPKILALNRQRAQVLVGERVAYLSTTQTETAATQTVQFLETGINLILRPFISRDGSIRMELYPSVSEATLRLIGDAGGIGFTTVPDESTNEITTNVRVRDGETVVLGGLFMDKATINRRSVPGLGDIPIAGNAFKGQDDKVDRQEIIFLVTPTIVREEIMTAASEEADKLVKNIVVGVREGLLPWSRETLATNSSHDAYQALETGDVDLAISHINRSLRNKPNQPELVQMREDLLGERSIYADDGDVLRGIFDRSFNRVQDENGVVKPASDPLSSRINNRETYFGQMTAVPAFGSEPTTTSAETSAETPAETPAEVATAEDPPADAEAAPTTDMELETALASAYFGAEPQVESGEFNAFDDNGDDEWSEPLVDATDEQDEFEDDSTKESDLAPTDETMEPTFEEETDAYTFTSTEDADITEEVVAEDAPETTASDNNVNVQAFEEDTETAPTTFTEFDGFTFEEEPAESLATTSEREMNDEASEEFEEKMDAEPFAFADADETDVTTGSNDTGFNLFLDSLFRTRLVDWWIAQSKERANLNENLVSVDEE